MPKTAVRLFLALLVGTSEARPPAEGQLGVRFRREPGVETRLLLTGQAILPVGPGIRLRLAGAGGVLDNPGLAAYGLDAEVRLIQAFGLRVRTGAAHEQWRDWQAGENRVFGMVTALPRACLTLGVGLMWRAAIFDPTRYASPFSWRSPVPEWNIAYLLDWALLRRPGAELSLRLANQDLLIVHNPQQLPLGLRGRFSVGTDWHVSAGCGTAITGLSGPILSASELTAELGVTRDF